MSLNTCLRNTNAQMPPLVPKSEPIQYDVPEHLKTSIVGLINEHYSNGNHPGFDIFDETKVTNYVTFVRNGVTRADVRISVGINRTYWGVGEGATVEDAVSSAYLDAFGDRPHEV